MMHSHPGPPPATIGGDQGRQSDAGDQKATVDTDGAATNRLEPPVTATPVASRRRTRQSDPVFPEERLVVRSWSDPVLDNLGHDPRSPYVEQFWLAVLGPSCLFLIRRLAAGLERSPEGFELDSRQWAGELGLGMKGGKHGPFWRALDRACRFQLAQRNGELLVVRRRMAPLTSRQVRRLPPDLRSAHSEWLDQQRQRPQRRSLTSWSINHNPADAA